MSDPHVRGFRIISVAVGRSVSFNLGTGECSYTGRGGLLLCLGLSGSQEKLSQ